MNIRTLSLVGLCIMAPACFQDPGLSSSGPTSSPSSTSDGGPSSISSSSSTDPTSGSGSDAMTTGSTSDPSHCGNGVLDPGEGCDDGNAAPNDGCSPDCVLEFCGDGVIQSQEECDDGNPIEDDECTSACTLPRCGDGFIQNSLGEECDDGPENGAGNSCMLNCTLNVCGDGFVGPDEECDDGNEIADDACSNSCTVAACGDAIVQPGEECDDGNQIDTDGCSSACEVLVKRVFVSSQTYTANLGGPDGADAKCQALAQEAGLQGPFFAWLSGSSEGSSPQVRFTHATIPYVLVNGVKVADDWDDLTDGTLDAAIDLDEHGNSSEDELVAFTNTSPSGLRKSSTNHCDNYTTSDKFKITTVGHSVPSSAWTDAAVVTCVDSRHIYCVEQ